MAEAEEPKTLTLAQQWVLQENAQHQEERGETPAEARQTTEEETPANADLEEPVTDKTVDENSAVEEPVIEKFNEEASAAEETVVENSDESSANEGSTDVADNKESEEHEAAEEKPSVKIETAPVDFRFPTTNQTRHCFTRYVEYHRCVAVKGEDASECDKFAKYYRSLCPGEWIDRWNEQRENGTFPGPL